MATCAQVAPINPFLTPSELKKQLGDVQACAIVSDKLSEEKAAGVAAQFNIPTRLTLGAGGTTLDAWKADESLALDRARLPKLDDFALLIFTGGSTGVPKGVNHTHRGLLYSVLQHVTVWPCKFGEERFLNVAPMFHIWGLGYSTLVPIYTHSTLVMVPRYDADKVVQGLSDHKITVFAGGPAPIYMGLLTSPLFAKADLSQLRYCPSGGAPCPEELHREWLEKTGQPILEGWGMTEGAPFCLNLYDGKRKLLSVGNPVPGTELQVVDLENGDRVLPLGERGEFRVRGPQMMTGYRNQPEETARTLRDGWVYTGDIGYVDEEGFVFLVDRKKDMVIVGGYNVYPREVDEVLFKHPKIREAATVGKRDPRLGEVLVAFVVLDAGATLSKTSSSSTARPRWSSTSGPSKCTSSTRCRRPARTRSIASRCASASSAMALKRPTWPAGRVVTLEHTSKVLADNPLGDPHVRTLDVWLPPQYDQAQGPRPRRAFPRAVRPRRASRAAAARTRPGATSTRTCPSARRGSFTSARSGPSIIVFPDCFTAFGGNQYVNSSAVGRYADYLTRELVPFVDREFRTLAAREHRGVFGKSSGGYGALIHAMKYPRYWGAAACHSGDAGFDFIYAPEWPSTLDELARHRRAAARAGRARRSRRGAAAGDDGADDGRIARFLAHVWAKRQPSGAEIQALTSLAMAATYDPDPKAPNGFRVPYQPRDRRAAAAALAAVAAPRSRRARRALRGQPAHVARPLHRLRLARPIPDSLRRRQLSLRLAKHRVPHVYEEFDGTHSGVDYRMERSLPFLSRALR